jgi:hypothetical protein
MLKVTKIFGEEDTFTRKLSKSYIFLLHEQF